MVNFCSKNMEQRGTYLLTHSFIKYLFGAKEGPSTVLKMFLDKKGKEPWKHRYSPSTENVNHRVTPGQWGHTGRGTPRSGGNAGRGTLKSVCELMFIYLYVSWDCVCKLMSLCVFIRLWVCVRESWWGCVCECVCVSWWLYVCVLVETVCT